jgi:hypothetical protein
MKGKVALNAFLISLIFLGILEYFKIGRSLISVTLNKNLIYASPFEKDAGTNDSLPNEVISAKHIIDRNQLKVYDLTDFFLNDAYIYQRMIEFSYPARVGQSNTYIGLVNGDLARRCTLIDRENRVALYDCK